jgi:hypothetical protein
MMYGERLRFMRTVVSGRWEGNEREREEKGEEL